ncbi:MAG: ribonuclease H-like domain-containing protein [Oligosphaeraceae bacterium]|nr:ribonuclease H-like domain-containing protein [Oligosphaeraceae bacterium]
MNGYDALSQAFLHFPQIGPKRRQELLAAGLVSWQDLPEECPPQLTCLRRAWAGINAARRENLQALTEQDWQYFASRLDGRERWRLLVNAWEEAVFLDIETSGLSFQPEVTVISCWDGQELRLFVRNENLEDFLDYADGVRLFVTFNGAQFDLPVLRQEFHIPEISPAAHLDLRWICRQAGYQHGLKSIERQLSILRPADLQETNGEEAVYLWQRWQRERVEAARRKLLRYCAADTIALQKVAALLQQQYGFPQAVRMLPPDIWTGLNQQLPALPDDSAQEARAAAPAAPAAPAVPPESFLHTINGLEDIQARLQRFLQRKK